jgi:hypothetical protein
MNLSILRQLLTVVPEFYAHSYSQQGKLIIDSTQDLQEDGVTERRLSTFKERLMERCISRFMRYCQENGIADGA